MASKKAATNLALKAAAEIGYIDTHVHVDSILSKWGGGKEESQLASLWDSEMAARGCRAVVHVTCDPSTYATARRLLDTHPWLYVAAGVHPCAADTYSDAVEAELNGLLDHPRVLGCGECGLDYHHMRASRELQRDVFARQIRLAVLKRKVLVVHTRDADEDTLSVLEACNVPRDYPIHLHCFTGGPSFAERLLARYDRLCFGWTGVVTYSSAEDIRQAVRAIPLSRFVLETDGPYMMPRGARHASDVPCHSGHIPYTVLSLSDTLQCSPEVILQNSLQNSLNLYGFQRESLKP